MIKLNNISITIGAFYSPPRHNITNIIFIDYFIIGDDFNVKHNSWDYSANNPSSNDILIPQHIENVKDT